MSSAFPEEKCPECFHYSAPVKKYGEWYIRSHRRKVKDDYADS